MFRFFCLGYKRGLVANYVWSSLLLASLLPATALAQSAPLQARAALRGTVANERGAPVEMATLTLHRAADSVAVKTEFSDAKGDFVFDALAAGSYRLSVAQVGYARYWSAPLEMTAAGLTLGSITLKASAATALQEVTVTARKPLYEHTANGTSVNVADNPLSAGATTLEVLSRSPGVTLDAVSNLALRGRQGLLVVIDGRRTPLTGVELADYLRALPAEQVQSLELLTNPPAQYDAQGGAGVIIITLKKDQRLGTNGSVNASYGRGRYGKFVTGFNLNHRGKRYNLYGTYSFADREYFTAVDFTRSFAALPNRAEAMAIISSNQQSQLRSHTAKVSLDVNLGKRTLLGASVSSLLSQVDGYTNNTTWLYSPLLTIDERFTSTNSLDLNRPNLTANLNLKHTFADSANAATLSADADVARYGTARFNNIYTYFDTPGQQNALLQGDQSSILIIRAAKVDYARPLPHRIRLEAGAKATLVTSDNSILFREITQQVSTVDTASSQPFFYRENVNAAYVNLRGLLSGVVFQAGLRAEQTNIRAEQGPLLNERHYLQLFPSLTLERTLNRDNALTLSIARRVDRPDYLQLSPVRNYFDVTSYITGNPNLVAATTFNSELTHTYKGKFSTSLAYARTALPIVNVVQPAPDGSYLAINQFANLSTRDFFTLSLTAPLELRKWWTVYANGLFYYNSYTGTLTDTYINRGGFGAELTVNSSFVLPRGWSVDLNTSYESRQVFNYQNISQRGQLSLGMQKGLWHNQGTLRLTVTDILYTRPYRVTATYDTFSESYYSRQDTRVATLALTYRFGNSKVAAARKRAAGADDELRRAGTGQ